MQALFSRAGVDFRLPGSSKGSTQATSPLRFHLIGANPTTRPAGEQPTRADSNYLLGADSSRWIAHVPNYSRVAYPGIYPGVSLVFYGRDGELEHDFNLAPGADPAAISFRMEGAQRVELSTEGNLRIASATGSLVLRKPTAYQEVGGKPTHVDVSFMLAPDGRVSFRVGSYDRSRPLVIDPVLTFSTYIDGSATDNITAVTTDGSGNIYLTGFTTSTDFPTIKPLQPASGCGFDACDYVFITKLDPTGKTLIYSTYLGGGFLDFGGAIAVDARGDAIVAGISSSSNFPQAGSLPARSIRSDCYFIASLTPDGSAFNYSGLIGGSQGAYAPNNGRLAVDTAGNAYLAGVTDDVTFPITPGTLSPTFSGYPTSITFIMKVAPSGQLLYSTVIPGNAPYNPLDVFTNLFSVTAISIDASGQAIVAGSAGAGLPTTSGVVAPNYPNATNGVGGEAGFILQLNPTASAINYATYIPGTDLVGGMAIDSKGNFYLAGETAETNLPTSATAYQKTVTVGRLGGIESGYIIELNPQVTSVLAATYLNGTNSSINQGTSLRALALDSHNNVFVGGLTASADFPLQDPLTAEWVYYNMVLAALPPDLSSLSFGSYLSSADGTYPGSVLAALTVDANDNYIVAGTTYANDFPTTAGSFQPSPPPPAPTSGTYYGHTFVAKINMSIPAPSVCPGSWNVNLGQVNALSTATVTLNVTNCGNAPLNINSITSSLATVTTAENCGSVAPGAICPITLTFSPIDSTLSGGTISLADNAVVSPQVITVSGQGLAPKLSPQFNPFPMGHYLVGTQSPAYSLVLDNQGNAPLIFSSIAVTGNGFSINQNGCTGPVPNGSGCILSLVFAPTVSGAASGVLTIASNDPVHPQLAIGLSGAGDSAYDAPSISLVGSRIPVSQQTVPINSGPVSLQVEGSNFYPASVVQFNGVPQPTTFVTNSLLKVSLLASSLTALGEYPLTVVNPAPGGGASPAVIMTTYRFLPLTTSAIISVPATKLIYAAIPSMSSSNPNTVIPIDPSTGTTKTPIPVGKNPVLLAASSDGTYLYVATGGDSTLQRINLATNLVEATFPFAPNVYCPQCEILPATDLQTIPGAPQEVVLAQGHMAALYNGSGLVNYVPSTQILFAAPTFISIAFAGNPLTLYAEPFTSVQNSFFNTAAITSSGLSYAPVSGSNQGPPAGTGSQIVSDGTLLYTNSGQVWDPSTRTQVGSFPLSDTYDTGDSLVLDTSLGQLYAAGMAEPRVELAITSYGVKSLGMQSTLEFPSINAGELGSLTRWGNNGFAFFVPFVYTDAAGIYLIRSDGLTNQQLLNPAPSLISFSPTSANAGAAALTLTVTGKDFIPSSTVAWNGAALPTTYISGAQLMASIPASDLTTAGTVDVTVITPAPGGGTSSLQGFTINPVAPAATISGSSIDFGTVTQGAASAQQPLTLTNSGNSALAISSIAATGDFAETNNCGTALAISASCQIQVVFTPTATGVRSGTLTLVDNAPGAPQSITLQGTGVAPVSVAPAAGGSTTATVPSGGTANYNLSLAAAPGFAGNVTVSCSGAPQNATCTVTPATFNLSTGGSAKFSVAVVTSAPQSAAAALVWRSRARLAGLGIASLLLLPLLQRIRRGARCFSLCVAVVCVAFSLSGCGGASMTTPSNPAPLTTPAGTYQLTVTATAGASQVKQSLTLTVQ